MPPVGISYVPARGMVSTPRTAQNIYALAQLRHMWFSWRARPLMTGPTNRLAHSVKMAMYRLGQKYLWLWVKYMAHIHSTSRLLPGRPRPNLLHPDLPPSELLPPPLPSIHIHPAGFVAAIGSTSISWMPVLRSPFEQPQRLLFQLVLQLQIKALQLIYRCLGFEM